MKNIIVAFLLCIIAQTLYAQDCCEIPLGKQVVSKTVSSRTVASAKEFDAVNAFSKFFSNNQFIEEHIAPLPFTLAKAKGEMKSLPMENVGDAKPLSANIYEVKQGKGDRVLLVFHEWWGLNDYIKRETEKYAEYLDGTTVIAVDLYDGAVATKPDKAGEFARGLNPERAKAIIQTVLQYAGKDTKIGTVGWCMGGSWSLQSTLLADAQAKACVMYYGMPERNIERLKLLKAPVLGIFAKQDRSITPAIVGEFETNLERVGKSVTVKMYDAVHAFANPSNPNYKKDDAEDAFNNAIEFLKQYLK